MDAAKGGGDAFSAEMLQKLAARLKQLRKQKGFANHERFANELNVGRSQYWRYENAENIEFTTLVKIVKALNMTLAEFFSEGFE